MAAVEKISSFESETSEGDVGNASPATRRVLAALYREAIPYTLKLLDAHVRTPEEIAEALDCDVDFIVLCTLFRGKATKKPFLLLHSAAMPINEKILGALVGENLARADADYVTRMTGYPPGSVPPIGIANRVPVMLDSSVMRFARVWVPAGSPGAIVSVPTMVIARAISARIVRLDH